VEKIGVTLASSKLLKPRAYRGKVVETGTHPVVLRRGSLAGNFNDHPEDAISSNGTTCLICPLL